MTWPLAVVTVVGIIGVTVAIVAPLYITHMPLQRLDTHHLDLSDEATKISWPQREEA